MRVWITRLWLWGLLTITGLARAYSPVVPAQLWMEVTNTEGTARSEVVRSGVPLPRSLDLRNTSSLAVVNQAGTPVPAAFHVLARWHAQRDNSAAPIQWLLVVFSADVAANATARYRLSIDGSIANPAATGPLSIVNQAGGLLVNTGAARFAIGADPSRSFDSIRLADGTVVATGGLSGSRIEGSTEQAGFSSLRELRIERQDAFSAVIVLSGVTAHPARGGGSISGERRYLFTRGSASAEVRETLQWEGDFCSLGALTCGNQVNGLQLEQWRSRIVPGLSGTRELSLLAQRGATPRTATLANGDSASLRQRRRSDRFAPQQFELQISGQAAATGERADGGSLVLAGGNGVLGIALQRMHEYEPQALRLLADGTLALDLADDAVWIGPRQALYASWRVGAYAPGTAAAQIHESLWNGLHRPLLAMPEAAWIAASRAVDELPVGPLPTTLARYDSLLTQILDLTISKRRQVGMQGLATFGLFPRNWGDPTLVDELDCGPGSDPTPANDWDDTYWCGFWTDYHNTSASAVYASWRSRQVQYLHELSFPAALRMLYTQVIRCAPDSQFFYCGMAPAGYGGYRFDNNSSHQYFDNLMLYYWQTGDESVWRTLAPAARTFRAYLCPARGSTPPGPVCAATTPISDPFARLNDRVASQFYSLFRFIALASPDASYLDDWTSNTARWLSRNYVQGQRNGQTLGFIETSGCRNPGDPLTCEEAIDGPGSFVTSQLWMASLYDFQMLYRLDVDSGNAALGQIPLQPRTATQAWARMLSLVPGIAPGNGTVAGIWPNEMNFSYGGARIGGSITSVAPGWSPGPMPMPCFDSCLYVFGKATLTGVVARSAEDLNDPALRALAFELVDFTLDNIEAVPVPLGKGPGEYWTRLHAAVARLQIDPNAPLFANGFE